MSAGQILARLADRGITVWLRQDGQIGYRARVGSLQERDVEELRSHRDEIAELLAERTATVDRRPLSDSQMRIWLLDRRYGASPGYNIGGAFRLTGLLDVLRFRAALRAVVDRHDALRTRIVVRNGLPILEVARGIVVKLPVVDVPPGRTESVLWQMMGEQLGLPFDLGTAPLFRAALLRRGPTDHVAVLVGHHIVTDDHSIGVIGRQTLEYYARPLALDDRREPDPRLAVPIAVSRPRPARPALLARRRHLQEAPDQGLPNPFGAGSTPTHSVWDAESYREHLTAAEVATWRAGRRASRTTTLTMSVALAALAVRAAGGPSDLLVGAPDLGREHQEDMEAVGCFTATMVLRAQIRESETFGAFAASLTRETAEAQQTKYVPYEELAGRRAHSQSGGTVLWVAPYAEPELPRVDGLVIDLVAVTSDMARHDLRIAHFARQDALDLVVTRRVAAVDASFTQQVSAALVSLHRRVPEPGTLVGTVLAELQRRSVDVSSTPASRPAQDSALLADIRARRRRAASVPRRTVEVSCADEGHWGPATVVARVPGLSLIDWTEAKRETVRELVRDRGAVLLRGFVDGDADFGAMLESVAGTSLVDYVNRSTPRTRVDGNIFTSTEYPATETIPLHSEQSYTTRWPQWLAFMCERAPDTGGATPLAPTAEVLRALPPDLVRRFARYGVRYERWYHPHLDLPWTEVFQTERADEVDHHCTAAGIETHWYEGDVLHTRQRAQATVRHPTTGEVHWFNQAHIFHVGSLPADVRRGILTAYGDRPPRHAVLGDGSPIDDVDLYRLQEAWRQAARSFPWQDGDVLIVDNLAVAHGREPYTGQRRVLVAMAGTGEGETAA